MKVYSKTRKAHYWNEDRFINGKGYCVVLDGATPLIKQEGFNGARWLVDYIKRNFSRYRYGVKERLEGLCRDAFRDLPIAVKGEDYLPSASACWVEFEGGRAKIGILGDCEVTAIAKDGKITRFCDGRLSVLDKIALDEMCAVAKEKNISNAAARPYITETLVKHRRLANKEGGYAALTLSADGTIDERGFEIETEGLREMYLYSDGFSQSFEHLGVYPSHEAAFSNIGDLGAEIEKIEAAAFGDRSCEKFPRFKVIDDITVTKIEF